MASQKTAFLRGKKVILRPVEEQDAKTSLRWVNDPEIWKYLTIAFPTSRETEQEWVRGLYRDNENIVFAIDTIDGGRYIGNMGLHRIDWKNQTAITGAMIGEKECQRKGYGTDAKMILLNYAFNTLNLRKISSFIYSHNGLSLRYSEKCGYHEEARRSNQFFWDGRYHDEIVLSVCREEWLPLWEQYRKEMEK